MHSAVENQIRAGDYRAYRAATRQLYDGLAGSLLRWGSLLSLHEPLVGRLCRNGEFDVDRCTRVLDIGAGAGQLLFHLVRKEQAGRVVVAFDLSHQMLRRAQERIGDARATYVAGDLARLPFADNAFDCVTCGWVLEHLPDPRDGLREMTRVLQPGGRLLLLATEESWPGRILSRIWNCRTYNRQQLRRYCERAGIHWKRELWLSPIHRCLRMGGIVVEATKSADRHVSVETIADRHAVRLSPSIRRPSPIGQR